MTVRTPWPRSWLRRPAGPWPRSRVPFHAAHHHRRQIRTEGLVTNTCSLVAVVDDSESVRESLPDLLQQVGYAVQTFASAEAFLASEVAGKTNCLLLDVGLPGMSGPDLQEELIRQGSSIPIVF